MAERKYGVVVYGATGFTGRLVAEYLDKTYRGDPKVCWAMAGRSLSKLEAVRAEMGIPDSVDLITADASDPESLKAMADSAHVVITTVGPYQLYGEPLLAACAEAGTDYVDLCGEPAWMAQMIGKYQEQAGKSGARLVFSCGFDSVPFDMGVWFLQAHAQKTLGAMLPRVKGRVRKMKGTFSGGTAASLTATIAAVSKDRSLLKLLTNPFSLCPGYSGPKQPHSAEAEYDETAQSWTAPFIMAPINTKNVHRSNFLAGHPYGADFIYDERMLTGDGPKGEKRAKAAARQEKIQNIMLAMAPTRWLLKTFMLPKPGEGPDKEARETGFYDVLFIGEAADGQVLKASVKGDRDPGYGSTSKMISECALCLLQDIDRQQTPGGVWAPAAAMGQAVIDRLQAKAGLTFAIEG
ncbi:saccharopine dehydrogenase NADP-binding domain-containing protein [Hyphobacterium sp. HN65]|uniref:Saccharopine dehydrogenase NADP-binding domain-containing protein n=1 Tax=Hyphobacterium lacteum TaxID=3116575 RepID=A0ABU7LRK7_9PROT|nr:saccharopine dehydrogenase NADP-binding domain-containing protein [Hyphobacterium sp. HN65]MEE2526515.1 saccharopine dehydrogenase NADP-binding domain-containing protein [Hyphobacterium sp. HN65]